MVTTPVLRTDRMRHLLSIAALLVLAIGTAGCVPTPEDEVSATAESWSVTAWGSRYEVFPEVEALVAGEPAIAHTHVTRLEGFAPLVDGEVAIVLAGPSGEQVFVADTPVRPGIFSVEIVAAEAAELELSFRIQGPEGHEEIRGGRVRVGTAQEPGGLLVAPAPKGASDGGEPLAFLKEEQWRSEFGTKWVRPGRLASSVSGLARVRPPAGGEILITSPVDGVLQPPAAPGTWPFVGLEVEQGRALFRLAPRIARERSLASLEAELASLETELETARSRLERLEELLSLEATSAREVEEARSLVRSLEARASAAVRDLSAARSSREGGSEAGLTLRASFEGEIAEITASPGATVAAGERLARLVRTDLVWFEIAVAPEGARQIALEGVRGLVLTDRERSPLRLEEGLRMVAVAPELSARTGTVTVLLEAAPSEHLTLGSALDARILSGDDREGIVIPASALVDDGGVPIVYLQLTGESFVRQPVDVQERQGDLVLVDGLIPGQRLVARGGESIRRSSLMASGEAHGHVH